MEFPPAAVIGALVGLVIGYVDFKMVAGVVRAKWQTRFGATRQKELDWIQFGIFAVTVIGFPIVGYLLGLEIG
ncbi:hypothetical protein [Coralliovum pocilloporae]|uniref:hypothetical protein n=1 Tax=Coralliovum pocilloporae TaxID=3066369 RepID=UPI003306D511